MFSGSEKENSNKSESVKTRSDLSNSILEQLTLPLRDGHTVTLDQASASLPNPPDDTSSNDPCLEINVSKIQSSCQNLLMLLLSEIVFKI